MTAAVTDTPALLWYAIGPHRKLGRAARALFARAEHGEARIHVPALVLVEIAEAMRRGVVRSTDGFTRWADRLLASGHFVAADLTMAIVAEAESLYVIPERGDRLIAATAAHLQCPLITRDAQIGRQAIVETVW